MRLFIEYRLLQFAQKDIELAVERWLRANGELGQYGRSGDLSLSEHNQKIRVAVQCWDLIGRQKENMRSRTLNDEETRQAMILFCKDHSIPLSRKGKKVLKLIDGMLALAYRLP